MEKKNFDIDFAINCDPITTSKILSQNNIAVFRVWKNIWDNNSSYSKK